MDDNEIYRELQKHLDKMPVGFPATDSGIEIRVLKHLFTPEEAKIASYLNFQQEPLKKIHKKLKHISSINLEKALDDMYFKGLINRGKRIEGDSEVKYYGNAFFLIGFFEYQVNRLTKEFIDDAEQYLKEAFWSKEFNKPKIPQLRTIPVEESIELEKSVSSYDEIRSLIENSGGPIAVAECICRKKNDLFGESCEKTKLREACFTFRGAAESYIEKGVAREISKEEAYIIIKKAEDDGLVLQPGNSLRPMALCTCCGCCCEVLTNQKRFPEPVQFFATNYFAAVDSDKCIGCGICGERCNMDAVHVEDALASVDKSRCIGCGVCIPTCTSEAIGLIKKVKETIPPKNTFGTYMAIMNKKAELARAEKS
ncbi:MAG: indolepyruvate ferredoxin oxidoreductase subunit alpha [Promethearchaeota archaeon]|jgi:ferredoxin